MNLAGTKMALEHGDSLRAGPSGGPTIICYSHFAILNLFWSFL